jgi:Holliday junction resolvase RusA-like endonuclease
MKIIILGEPVAKGRPRVGNGFSYTPAKTQGYENLVKMCYMEQCKGENIEGGIEAYIDAYFTIPKAASKKKADEMDSGLIRPLKRPDLDNVIKLCLDALNGLAYNDDCNVIMITARKFYSKNPRVEIELLKH